MVSGGVKFLKEVLNKPGVIFGLVNKCATKLDNFVEITIDGRNLKYFQNKEDLKDGQTVTRYCYFFESILTSMREFRALKQMEFTRLCPLLTYPSIHLERGKEMTEKYSAAID